MKSLVKVLAAAIIVAMSSVSANAQSFNNEADEVDQFFTTMINVPAKVQFVEGETYSVEVKAQDEEVAKGVKYQVVGGVLFIYLSNGMEAQYLNSEDITIVISTPKTTEVKTSKDFSLSK